ncbi:ferredoxin [Streptantibioticus ferralitis]|uniref:ferredoxin n=1 Tax=Streptantibioticus ferralitis TaxID=236510 RepID=UPI003557974F
MSAVRIEIDRSRCRGAGQCALHAPELFDQSEEDGMVVVLDDQPPPELLERARLAERLCPNSVIRVLDDEQSRGGPAG